MAPDTLTFDPTSPQTGLVCKDGDNQHSMGFSGVGGSSAVAVADTVRANLVTIFEDGDALTMWAYLSGGGGASQVRGLLYADAAGTPGALLGATEIGSVAAAAPAAWIPLPFDPSFVIAAASYWVGLQNGNPMTASYYYDVDGAWVRKNASDVFSDGPAASWPGTTGSDTRKLSQYLVYSTPSGDPPLRCSDSLIVRGEGVEFIPAP